MTLGEWLGNLPDGQLVKIGAKDGNGFVYCGRADGFDQTQIVIRLFTRCGLMKRNKAIEDSGKPLLEREVKDVYPSITEPALICLTEGCYAGKQWMINKDWKPEPEQLDDQVCMNLALAIYGAQVDDMKRALDQFRKRTQAYAEAQRTHANALELMTGDELMRMPETYTETVMDIYTDAIVDERKKRYDREGVKTRFQLMADWICGDQYGIFTDPVGIVDSIIRAERAEHENKSISANSQRHDRRVKTIGRLNRSYQ